MIPILACSSIGKEVYFLIFKKSLEVGQLSSSWKDTIVTLPQIICWLLINMDFMWDTHVSHSCSK